MLEEDFTFKKTGLLTKRTVKEIEDLIVGNDIRENLYVPNVSWGFFVEHEADLVKVSRSGFLTEYEIKRSWSDFVADFKKRSYHSDDRISEFYYVVPKVMAQAASKFIDESSMRLYGPGIYYFSEESGWLSLQRKCNRPKGTKMYVEDMYEIARLGTLRYWSLRRKNTEYEKKEPEWIRCIDKLPFEHRLSKYDAVTHETKTWFESEDVLTCDSDGTISINGTVDGKWKDSENVVAWRKIPEIDFTLDESKSLF